MKITMLAMVMVGMFMGTVLAGVNDDANAVIALGVSQSTQGLYSAAQATLEGVALNFPKASDDVLARSVVAIADNYTRQSNVTEALNVLWGIPATYPKAKQHFPARSAYRIGCDFDNAGSVDYAISVFTNTLTVFPEANRTLLFNTQKDAGRLLFARGDRAAAQAIYMNFVKKYVWELGATNESSYVWSVYEKIEPEYITLDEYTAFLNSVIKATRAVPENARFLGRVASDRDKLKK